VDNIYRGHVYQEIAMIICLCREGSFDSVESQMDTIDAFLAVQMSEVDRVTNVIVKAEKCGLEAMTETLANFGSHPDRMVIIVSSIDKLAKTFQKAMNALEAALTQGATVIAAYDSLWFQPGSIETVSALRKAENDLRNECFRNGVAAAKARGAFPGGKKGRVKATVDLKKIAEMHRSGISKSEIARELGLARGSVRKYVAMALTQEHQQQPIASH
jgi:DNA invertase Pin-like site-specific DNA recombinase